MCEKTKRKIDRATILYKIFLVAMIISEIYVISFMALPIIGVIAQSILILYLIFRYYMLVRMKNRAIKLDLTLTEFLQERDGCHSNELGDGPCEGCDECEGWDDWG